MDGTLFRFVVTRSAQDIPREQLDQTYVRAYRADLRQTPTSFFAELLVGYAAGDTVGMLAASRVYLDQSPEYVRSLAQLVPIIPQLDDWIQARRDPAGTEAVAFLDAQVTGGLGPLVLSADYATARQRTGDSLLALALATPEDQAAQAILKRAVRLFALIERADADRNSLTLPGSLERAMSAIVVMPNPPYPAPAARNARASRARVTAARALRAREEAARTGAADHITYIARHEKALDELVAAYEADRLAALSAPSPAGESAETDGQRPNVAAEEPGNGAGRPRLRIVPTETHVPPILLSRQAASRLSQDTRGLLQELSIEASRVSPVDAVNRLEARISELAGQLQRGAQGHRFVMVGASLVDTGVNTHNPPGSVVDPGGSPCPVPGDVSDVAPETPAAHDEPLSPGPGSPDSFIMRIGDLELVEQTLLGYELGEAAYIENVLTGERRERTHRHLTRSEETTFVETERTETTERDTQTTERFDLQQETQSLIREDVSRQAGVNVAGSYGTVEVTADARYATNTSAENTRRTATDHSREVVDRTVSRIVERVLQQRTLRTLDETEETNLHLLDNVTGQTNVTGIYRWVNKVYKAQVINYGQRLMFELVVSEPAALYRFAAARRATPDIDLVKPNPPGYYRPGSNTFVPLQPQDIDACNYLAWVSAYGAAGVQPPPPMFRLTGKALEKSDLNGKAATEVVTGLAVPQGYTAQRAYVIDGQMVSNEETDEPSLSARVGRKYLENRPGANTAALNAEIGEMPASTIGANIVAYVINIEVECQRTEEFYQSWKLATYEAIMQAYQTRLAEYQDALSTATQNTVTNLIQGANPLRNQEIIRDELKRSAISIITGQQFDEFNATRMDETESGFPQMYLPRNSVEGPFVRFIEQAFEWENMAYLFYPYFWSRKPQWPERMALDDVDPVFGQFLRAGAARVIVPVRPEFQIAVGSYTSGGWPIHDEADPLMPDDDGNTGVPLLSLVAEVQAQQGFAATPGVGTLSVVQGDAAAAGTETAFDADRDVNREIHIRGVRYRIRTITSATQIEFDTPYAGAGERGVRYLLGPQAIGEPWQVRVPTSLVILDTSSTLHDFRDV